MKPTHMILIGSLSLFACVDKTTQQNGASVAGAPSSDGGGPPSAGAPSSDGGSSDPGTPLSCADGDVVVRAWPIRLEEECISLAEGMSAGCGSPHLTDGFGSSDAQFVRSCWKRAGSGDLYMATVPLQNLHTRVNEWETCNAADLNLVSSSSNDALAISTCESAGTCERFAVTTCSADDTCAGLPCGGQNSAYSSDGCKRVQGADCSDDSDCASDEICAFIERQVSWTCGYDPSGVCACGGPAPLGALGGRCAKR